MPIAPPRTCRLAAAHSTSAIHYIDTTIGQSNQTCVSRNASHRCRAQKVKEEQKVFAVKKKTSRSGREQDLLTLFCFFTQIISGQSIVVGSSKSIEEK